MIQFRPTHLFAAFALIAGEAPPSLAGTPVASSIGDARMASLMDALLSGFRKAHPDALPPKRWSHPTDAVAVGVLMFERADMAPLSREPTAAELAPYDHQFRGDMMKAPLLVQVAWRDGSASYVAVNKRPDSPLPDDVRAFLAFALSAKGQAITTRTPGFAPLATDRIAEELKKLDGFVATLDTALRPYIATQKVAGEISSVGSDGMKSLMELWMNDFEAHQPKVARGERWEHLGTLNGFHALLAGEADIAPMGRELWPQELSAWHSVFGTGSQPLEIRVARGGFNTPQRTTAQAIFVSKENPLTCITMPQLKMIFGEKPYITRWGQLGLTGAWTERPIHVRTPPQQAPNAMSLQITLLEGMAWNPAAVAAPIAETAAAIAQDPVAIGFGGFEEGGGGIRPLALARETGSNCISGNAKTASTGRYPLTRYMYIRLAKAPSPQVREYLRFILGREGQDPIRYSGYFPLTAAEAEAELAKLDE